MRCMMCGLDPATASGPATIYRLNNKGQAGVWACKAHYAEAKSRYFPDDEPDAPAPLRLNDDPAPQDLGPWTGGVTPISGRSQ